MARIIDEMPERSEVMKAGDYRIVEWQLFLRPTMNNDELDIVKAIARRYDAISPSVRESHAIRARREHQ